MILYEDDTLKTLYYSLINLISIPCTNFLGTFWDGHSPSSTTQFIFGGTLISSASNSVKKTNFGTNFHQYPLISTDFC